LEAHVLLLGRYWRTGGEQKQNERYDKVCGESFVGEAVSKKGAKERKDANIGEGVPFPKVTALQKA